MRNKERYNEEWSDKIRPTILKRDDYKCCHCSVKHRSYVLYDRQGKYTYIDKDECKEYKEYGATAYRIFLQISHKNHNPSDNRPENLWSLCPRCHLRFDKDHRSLIRLLGGQSRTIPKIIPPEI